MSSLALRVGSSTLRRLACRRLLDRLKFRTSVREFRSATEVQADLALSLLPLLSRFSSQIRSELLSQIMDQFFREADRTRFSLTNAITSVARDTRDPEVRWRLEELGGAIAAGKTPSPSTNGPGVQKPRRQAVPVGVLH